MGRNERLSLKYVDLDDMIVQNKGKSISDIFQEEGESAFRAAESMVTAIIASNYGQVIACGGGTVLDSKNAEALKASSYMVLLTSKPETILKRIEAEGEIRPLLMVDDKLARIKSLLEERYSHYLEVADLIVDTTELTPEEVANIIMEKLGGV